MEKNVTETGFIVRSTLENIAIISSQILNSLSKHLSTGISQPTQCIRITAIIAQLMEEIEAAKNTLSRANYDQLKPYWEVLFGLIEDARKKLVTLWKTTDPIKYTIAAGDFATTITKMKMAAIDMNQARLAKSNMKR